MVNARITASAPGKLMLFGEHAVVYGRPCLVTAVGLRVSVTLSRNESDTILINALTLRVGRAHQRVTVKTLLTSDYAYRIETAFVEAAIEEVYRRYELRDGLRILTDGPAQSYGLGSSSAVTVATIAALSELFGLGLNKQGIFDVAHAVVLRVQGKASGFDVASAIHGGTIYYTPDGMMEPLTFDDNNETLPLVIGYSGDKASTRRYVGLVSALRDRQPSMVDYIFSLIASITDAAREGILQRDWSKVGDLMNLHQGLLDALGVNAPGLAAPIFAAREAGAWGAKLSGAGGGDCMFALVPPKRRAAVEQAIRDAGAQVVRLELGSPGVVIESVEPGGA